MLRQTGTRTNAQTNANTSPHPTCVRILVVHRPDVFLIRPRAHVLQHPLPIIAQRQHWHPRAARGDLPVHAVLVAVRAIDVVNCRRGGRGIRRPQRPLFSKRMCKTSSGRPPVLRTRPRRIPANLPISCVSGIDPAVPSASAPGPARPSTRSISTSTHGKAASSASPPSAESTAGEGVMDASPVRGSAETGWGSAGALAALGRSLCATCSRTPPATEASLR